MIANSGYRRKRTKTQAEGDHLSPDAIVAKGRADDLSTYEERHLEACGECQSAVGKKRRQFMKAEASRPVTSTTTEAPSGGSYGLYT